jgi:hypothetical protein
MATYFRLFNINSEDESFLLRLQIVSTGSTFLILAILSSISSGTVVYSSLNYICGILFIFSTKLQLIRNFFVHFLILLLCVVRVAGDLIVSKRIDSIVLDVSLLLSSSISILAIRSLFRLHKSSGDTILVEPSTSGMRPPE